MLGLCNMLYSINLETLDQAEALWEDKHVSGNFEAAIELYEDLYQTASQNRIVLERLSYAYSLKGYHFATTRKEQLGYLETSLEFIEQCLDLNLAYKHAKSNNVLFSDQLTYLGKDDLFCLLFKAQTRGQWAKTRGIGQSLKYVGLLKSMITRVGDIDSNFYYGAVDRYWGAFYANLPQFMGGSYEKSSEYFKQSIEVAPHYVGTYRLFIEDVVIPNKDSVLFDELINQALQFDVALLPLDLRLLNQIEQQKLVIIKQQKASYFKTSSN